MAKKKADQKEQNKNPAWEEERKLSMKKNLKLVLALIVAVMMIVSSISMMGIAETATKTQSIAITGLDKDDSVQFYKILSWADTSAIAKEKGAVSGWYWEEPFATAFDVDGDHGAAKLKAAINDNNELMMTDKLAGEINHTKRYYHDGLFLSRTILTGAGLCLGQLQLERLPCAGREITL